MQENRYNTCDRFLGGLEKDFIITEQIEDSPLTSEPSFLDYGIIAVVQGTDLKTGHVKLYDGMKMYFDSQKALKDNSVIRKKTTLNNQIKNSKLNNKFADRINAEEIQKLIEDLTDDGYSKSTVKHTKEAFTEYYNYLFGKYSHLNPAANLKLPRFDDDTDDIVEDKDILSDEEMTKFIVKCQEPASPHHSGCHYSDMFIVLMLTYMRVGEACGLQAGDFTSNPDGSGYIKINRTVTKKYADADKEKTTYVTGPPKTNHIIRIETSQRSSILSARNDMANTVRAVFQLAGANVTFGEGYPGWKPNPHSAILEVAVESYKRLFGVDAKVKAIHAGLECGLFLDKYPTLDMISFGPTLTGVHSPDERMLIPTVEKFWKHLLDILAHVPAKK